MGVRMSHSSQLNTRRARVLLIGSNPSSSTANNSAFVNDTKSGKLIQEWIKGIDADFFYDNVSRIKTDNNRPLSIPEIKDSLPDLVKRIEGTYPDRIVALGKTAHKALALLNIEHYEMPHPSGANRQLNDKSFTAEKIKEFATFAANPIILDET